MIKCGAKYHLDPTNVCQLEVGHAGSHRDGSDYESLTNKTLNDAFLLKEFAKLPLPQRMRAAAEVLTAVNDRQRYGHVCAYGRGDLIRLADRWEREDAERLGREKQVEELAQFIRSEGLRGRHSDEIAQALIDAGWTKGTGDE